MVTLLLVLVTASGPKVLEAGQFQTMALCAAAAGSAAKELAAAGYSGVLTAECAKE